MNKNDFIKKFAIKFLSKADTQKAEQDVEELNKYLSPYYDFEDLYDKIVMEWQKTSTPPIGWLKDKAKFCPDYKPEIKKYWMITGRTKSGVEYDFASEITVSLDSAKKFLQDKGLEYVRNNRQEIIMGG